MEPDGVLFLESSTNDKLVLPDGVLYLSEDRQYVSADSHQPLSSSDILNDAISSSPQPSPSLSEPANPFIALQNEPDGGIYDVLSNYNLTASPHIQEISQMGLPTISTQQQTTESLKQNGISLSGYPYYSYMPYLPIDVHQLQGSMINPKQGITNANSIGNMNNGNPLNDLSNIQTGVQLPNTTALKRTNEGFNHPSDFPSKEEYFKSTLREQQLQRYRSKKMRRVYTRPVDQKRSNQAKGRERNSRGRFVVNKQ